MDEGQSVPTEADSAGLPAAVLWDMDGTLVDTEPDWIACEFEMVESYGGTWTHDDAMKQIGNDLIVTGRYMRDVGGVPLTPEQIVEELLDRVIDRMADEVPWRPGALDLLSGLRAAGVRCALVTMSYERFATPVLAALPPDAFEVVVTGDNVSRGKPHPEPYLKAAAMLGVEPAHTVAIEDSATGASSAEAAGCAVVVVEHHVSVPEGARRVFVDSLEGLSVSDLALLGARVR